MRYEDHHWNRLCFLKPGTTVYIGARELQIRSVDRERNKLWLLEGTQIHIIPKETAVIVTQQQVVDA